MTIYKSGEDYLETILILEEKNGKVRSVDVANALGFSKPSISRGMALLREQGFITMGKDHLIVLTEPGRAKANAVYSRHKSLKKYFIEVLGVKAEIAEGDACAIEHIISQEAMDAINKALEKVK